MATAPKVTLSGCRSSRRKALPDHLSDLTTTFCISQVLHSNNGESTPQQWFIHQTLSEMILIHQAMNREPCCMAMLHGMLFKLKTSTKIQWCSEKINRQLYNICGNWNASAETTVHVDRNIIEIHRASGDIWYKNVQHQHIYVLHLGLRDHWNRNAEIFLRWDILGSPHHHPGCQQWFLQSIPGSVWLVQVAGT